MAPLPITEDYYMILEVEQAASLELIVKSYKRLALKLHPDRNKKHDATEAFQLLSRAYETLKDEGQRRAYDLIYPTITKGRSPPAPKPTQTPRPPPASTTQSGAPSEAEQIAALEKSKQERTARWLARKKIFDSSIFEMQRVVRHLEQEIKNLNDIAAAEAAEEAQKNSWGTWLLSPLYKKVEESEEEKARKDRARQERRIQKDMKERRLDAKKADLRREENKLRKAKEEMDAAILVDERKIRGIRDRIRDREEKERQERERVERERQWKIWKEMQEQREKEREQAAEALRKKREQAKAAAEALRKKQAEELAAQQKRAEEERKRRQKIFDDEIKRHQERYARLNPTMGSTQQADTSGCFHDGWWPKVQGRKPCPECHDIWTYLLECPGCEMKACPKCQAAIRPRRPRRAHPRTWTPSLDDPYNDYDW